MKATGLPPIRARFYVAELSQSSRCRPSQQCPLIALNVLHRDATQSSSIQAPATTTSAHTHMGQGTLKSGYGSPAQRNVAPPIGPTWCIDGCSARQRIDARYRATTANWRELEGDGPGYEGHERSVRRRTGRASPCAATNVSAVALIAQLDIPESDSKACAPATSAATGASRFPMQCGQHPHCLTRPPAYMCAPPLTLICCPVT
jgi:hypothetical protein